MGPAWTGTPHVDASVDNPKPMSEFLNIESPCLEARMVRIVVCWANEGGQTVFGNPCATPDSVDKIAEVSATVELTVKTDPLDT